MSRRLLRLLMLYTLFTLYAIWENALRVVHYLCAQESVARCVRLIHPNTYSDEFNIRISALLYRTLVQTNLTEHKYT